MKTCAKRSKMNDFTPLTLTREFHEDEAPLAIVDSHNNPTSSLGNGERLLTKCSPAKLLKLVKNLTPEQRAAVRKIGFGGLLNLRCSSLRRNLCWWLVQQFDEETSTIDIGGTSVPILEREMEYILGLRCDGKEVKVVDNKRIYGLTAHLREKYGAVGNKISVQVLVERLSSKEAGEDFVRDFILYVLAIFLCPPTNLRANAYYLLPLLNMDHVSQLSWGKHVHKFLIRSLVKAKRLHKHAVSGCLFFLQIWYYEHTNVGYPHQLNAIYPRIKLWGETEIKDRDALENAVDDFGSTKVCPPIWDTISGSSWPDKAGRKGQDADASGNSPSKELNKESLEEVVSHGSPHWEEFKRKACSKDTVGISELHEEIKALRQIVLEMQSAMTTQATSYELQLHSLLLEVQAQTLKQQSQNALLTELLAEVQSLKRSKTKCQHVCESQPAIVAKICGEGLSAQGPPEVQPPTIAISTMTSVGQLEPYNLSSDDSAASDMEEDDGAGNMMTRNKSIVLRSVKDVLSEDAVIRRAEMYQEYMKHIPIPSQRGTLIPFRTWQGLAKSIKQLYGQPLHYLTNILLKKWDEARIGTEDEYQPLDATIHPLKAEATIWLMEEVHRRTSSHHHLAELWASDSMHHSFVDPIFPQL